MVLYVLLAPYDHEQSDLLHRVHEEKKLEKLPIYWLVVPHNSTIFVYMYMLPVPLHVYM